MRHVHFSFFVLPLSAWYGRRCMWGPILILVLIGSAWHPVSGRSAEFGEIDLGAYLLGSWPRDQPIFNQGSTVSGSIRQGVGAGVKIDLFPHATQRMLAIEIDSSAHGGALSFSNIANGQHNGTGRSNILVLRYLGEVVTLYIGIGDGWSHGTLLHPNIIGRNDRDFDSAAPSGISIRPVLR